MVIATQNPIEQAGTYRLPEAQLDRFLMKHLRRLPRRRHHRGAADALRRPRPGRAGERVVTAADVLLMRQLVDRIHVDRAIVSYVRRIAEATREEPDVKLGLSTRGSLALVRVAKTWAASRGRRHVVPHDVVELAHPVLAHRVLLTPEASFGGVTIDSVIDRVLAPVAVPRDRAARLTRPRLTAAPGSGVLPLGSVARWSPAGRLGWTELLVLRHVGPGPRRARAGRGARGAAGGAGRAVARPARTWVDGDARRSSVHGPACAAARSRGRGPVGGRGRGQRPAAVPAARRPHREAIAVSTTRRGIHRVGPVTHLHSDPRVGAARVRSGPPPRPLRPAPDRRAGVAARRHRPRPRGGRERPAVRQRPRVPRAARDVTGDDLRHVHWTSSARASGLLVRQYEETRAHVTILVDERRSSYRGSATSSSPSRPLPRSRCGRCATTSTPTCAAVCTWPGGAIAAR